MEENGKTDSTPAKEGGTIAAGPDPSAPAAPVRADETRPVAVVSPGRPDIKGSREPLYRLEGGYRLRLDPADLARLRELPGSKGKSDTELGEQFFDGQAARLTGAVSEDVPAPAEVRVVVDPYSRQAFLAVGKTIRGIVSF